MKWFKHDSDASTDAKLRKVMMKYSATGYGLYWYSLELIARNVDKNNLTFELEHDYETIAHDFKLSSDFVKEIIDFMVNLGLFENIDGVITCKKMSTRTDDYTNKLINNSNSCRDKVPTVSGQNPEKSALIEENRIEKKRLEKKIIEKKVNSDNAKDKREREFLFNEFWNRYPNQKSKGQARRTFEKLNITSEMLEFKIFPAIERAKLAKWAEDGGRYIPHPSTWLNAEGWEDKHKTIETSMGLSQKTRDRPIFEQLGDTAWAN